MPENLTPRERAEKCVTAWSEDTINATNEALVVSIASAIKTTMTDYQTLLAVQLGTEAALAQVAELRRAIQEYRHWFDTCTRTLTENWDERAAAAIDALDTALSFTPDEALKRLRREERDRAFAEIDAKIRFYAHIDGQLCITASELAELRKGGE